MHGVHLPNNLALAPQLLVSMYMRPDPAAAGRPTTTSHALDPPAPDQYIRIRDMHNYISQNKTIACACFYSFIPSIYIAAACARAEASRTFCGTFNTSNQICEKLCSYRYLRSICLA